MVSGCALIVDYVLTIAISIASGADAIFSFLPVQWLPYKFAVAIAVVVVMVAMNLRGVKESVLALVPIFLALSVRLASTESYLQRRSILSFPVNFQANATILAILSGGVPE